MQCLIKAIVAVILLVGAASSCPSACGCTNSSNGVNVDCSSRGLDSIPTDLPNNTYILWLYNNSISVIENNAFNNLPNLQNLYLYNNKITSIKSDMFNNLTNLNVLYLSDNQITSIKSDTFNNLTNLNSLGLHYNDISVIEGKAFNNLPKLQYMELQNNDISVIEDKAFNNLPKLQYISLNNNKITSIKSDTFNNLTNLIWLYLHNNKITSIKSDMFNNLTNLNVLELQNNDISVIEDKAFNNLPKLQYIYLHNNKITSIKSDTFNNLTNLNTLSLNNSKITSIKSDTFNNLTNLYRLYLNNNNITSIKSDTFNNLTNLYRLELQNNDISVIEDKAFNNLPKLYFLWMDNNPIAFVSEHAFENLPRLPSLFFEMYCGGCENIPFWRWLKLNQTFSTSITCHDFDGQYLSNLQPNNFTDCSEMNSIQKLGSLTSNSPYHMPLKVRVVAVAATTNYTKDGMERSATRLQLADGTGHITAICYDSSKIKMLALDKSVLLRNYIKKPDNTIVINKPTLVAVTSPVAVPDEIKTAAVQGLNAVSKPTKIADTINVDKDAITLMGKVVKQQEEPTEKAIVQIDGNYDDEENVQIVTLVCHSEDNQDTIHDYTINTNLLEEAFAVEDGDLERCIVNLLPVKIFV